MRIAIAVNKNHPNYNIFLAFLTRFISSELDLKIEIVSYTDIDTIYDLVNKRCDYVLIMHRYCFVDFKRLKIWLDNHKPSIAGLSVDSNKNIGYPFLLLIKTSLLKPIDELYSLSPRDTVENYFLNLVHRFLHRNNKAIDSKDIANLDHICYLANCNYTDSVFHKSIFITLSDMDKNFANTMSMLSSGIKEVYYNDKLYKLKLGKSFFIYKYWNFAILPNRTVLVWNNVKNKWMVANKTQNKILQQIL